MKKSVLFTYFMLLLFLFPALSFSQETHHDEVYPIDGGKPFLNCSILQIENNNEITFLYKGKEYETKALIIKKDGKFINLREFSNDSETEIEEVNYDSDDLYFKQRHHNYVSLGFGAGASYGGFGIQANMRNGKNFSIGTHIGFGFIPRTQYSYKAMMGFKIGAKIYVYRPLYFDLAFGVVAISDYNVIVGPSLMTGADLFLGERIGINIAAGAGSMLRENGLIPLLDLGFFVKISGNK